MNRNFVQNQTNSKLELRKEMLSKRLALEKSFVKGASRKIAQKVISLTQIKEAKNISAYLPVMNEVETKEIIDHLVNAGRNVFLPTYIRQSKKYFFSLFNGWQNIELGPFGILQPVIHDSSIGASSDTFDVSIDLAILPGVAFDNHGVRLGYGKGVFDRLLANSKVFKVGLAYDFQIVDELPKEKHDLVMDLVVT